MRHFGQPSYGMSAYGYYGGTQVKDVAAMKAYIKTTITSIRDGRFDDRIAEVIDQVKEALGDGSNKNIAKAFGELVEWAQRWDAPSSKISSIQQDAKWFHCNVEDPNSSYCKKKSGGGYKKKGTPGVGGGGEDFWDSAWFWPSILGVFSVSVGGFVVYKVVKRRKAAQG